MATQEDRLTALERQMSQLQEQRQVIDSQITALQQQIIDQRRLSAQAEQGNQRALTASMQQILDAQQATERRQELHFSRLEALILTTARTQEAAMVAMESRLNANIIERSEQTLAAFRQLLEIVNSRLPDKPA